MTTSRTRGNARQFASRRCAATLFQAKSYYRGKFNFRHRAYPLRAEKRCASAIFDRSCSKLSNRNEGCASTISASIESNRFPSRNPDAKHWNATTVFFNLFAFILCYIGLPVTFANELRTTKESSSVDRKVDSTRFDMDL